MKSGPELLDLPYGSIRKIDSIADLLIIVHEKRKSYGWFSPPPYFFAMRNVGDFSCGNRDLKIYDAAARRRVIKTNNNY